MFKHCPRCKDEFVQHVTVCPDCRVPLVTFEELSSLATAAPHESETGGGISLASAVPLRRGQAADLRPLCEQLEAHGIRFVVDTHPLGRELAAPKRGAAPDVQLAIYVDEADTAEATRVEREWLVATMPDAHAEMRIASADVCPGCSEPLLANATACASCGLEFPPLELACPQCGQLVAVEAESCAGCGFRP